jgi:hypothetical protein
MQARALARVRRILLCCSRRRLRITTNKIWVMALKNTLFPRLSCIYSKLRIYFELESGSEFIIKVNGDAFLLSCSLPFIASLVFD